jgi:hypothetical protein
MSQTAVHWANNIFAAHQRVADQTIPGGWSASRK